jgi:hypothetical protein
MKSRFFMIFYPQDSKWHGWILKPREVRVVERPSSPSLLVDIQQKMRGACFFFFFLLSHCFDGIVYHTS